MADSQKKPNSAYNVQNISIFNTMKQPFEWLPKIKSLLK
jgi:hypothetical protein